MLFLYISFGKLITFFNSNNIETINIKDNINPTINTYVDKIEIIFNKYLNYNLFYHWKNIYKNKNKNIYNKIMILIFFLFNFFLLKFFFC